MRALLMIALLASGCGVAHVSTVAPKGTFASSWTPERCQVLLDQRDAAIWAAGLGGGLSSGGGVGTGLVADKDWQMGLGISTGILGAVGVSMTVLAKLKSDEFELYCNTGPVQP